MFLLQNSEISLFETNIRFMGSLLASYALTGDVMFRDKAAQLGERMLPAFQTETGIPHSLINLHTGVSFQRYLKETESPRSFWLPSFSSPHPIRARGRQCQDKLDPFELAQFVHTTLV